MKISALAIYSFNVPNMCYICQGRFTEKEFCKLHLKTQTKAVRINCKEEDQSQKKMLRSFLHLKGEEVFVSTATVYKEKGKILWQSVFKLFRGLLLYLIITY